MLSVSFLILLDTTVVNVALPSIAADLGGEGRIEWVVTAQLLALGVAQAPSGWLADRVGLRPVFIGSVAGFGLAATAAAAAPNLGMLVLARSVQGLMGGAALAVSTVLVYELAPAHSRGRTLGYAGALTMLAPALGPVLSGWVVGDTSWRWLLVGSLPAGLAASSAGARVLPAVFTGERRRFDWAGALLLTAALVTLLSALSLTEDLGVGSASFAALVAVALVLGAGFVVRSRRSTHPVIDLGLYRSRDFSLCMAVVATLALAQFARNVFIPLEMQAVRGLSPLRAGAVLTPGALAGALAMPVVGRVVDRVGPKVPVVIGLAVTATATAMLATTSAATSTLTVTGYVTASGVGTVMVAMPATLLSMAAVERSMRSQASAVRNLTRQVSGALGTAVLATVIAADAGRLTDFDADSLVGAQDAYNRGYLLAALLLVVGLVLALGLSSRQLERDGVAAEP